MFENNVLYVYAVFYFYAVRFEIFHERQNHALVLIIFRKTQCCEIG